MVALADGVGKASARSLSGVDIGAAIVAARERGVILEGGGHAMAGGFSLHADRLEEVHLFFMEHLAPAMTRYHASRTLKLDAPLTVRMATAETIRDLERAAPYGMGNPSPLLVLRDVSILHYELLKEQHIKLVVSDASGGRLKAMCFRAVGTPLGASLAASRGKTLHLAGTLKQEIWQNRPQITFMIQDAMEG